MRRQAVLGRGFRGLIVLAVLGSAPIRAQIVYSVDSTLDEIDDDLSDGLCQTAAETCTLRAAVMQANLAGGLGAIIQLPAGLYSLTRPVVGADGPDEGDLNLTTPSAGNPVIRIAGAGAARTIVDANDLFRVISVATGRTAELSGLTIRGGYAAGYGGGLLNLGTTTASACRIEQNQSENDGGGIYSGAALLLVDSTVSGNITQIYSGGGVAFKSSGELTLIRSTISGNQAPHGQGGGVYVEVGALQATNATISGNSAGDSGGGVWYGGGASANLYNTSIVFNAADSDADFVGTGGGAYAVSGSTFNLRNSLVAGNLVHAAPVASDCSGTVGSYGRNQFGSSDGCTIDVVTGTWSLYSSPATLGPLAANGGSTKTHALLAGSSAIDAADPVLGCIDDAGGIAVDQRGAARTAGAGCDVGAYEAGVLFFDDFESGGTSTWSSG